MTGDQHYGSRSDLHRLVMTILTAMLLIALTSTMSTIDSRERDIGRPVASPAAGF